MLPSSRLRIQFDPGTLEAVFSLLFAAPAQATVPYVLGQHWTRATVAQSNLAISALRLLTLGEPRAKLRSPATTSRLWTGERPILRWGDQRLTAEIGDNAAVADILGIDLPALSRFEIRALRDNPFAAMLAIQIADLQSGQRVRVDGGAGQIYWPEASNGELSASIAVEYAKAGDYTVAIDLLDDAGFWIGALGESTFSIEAPADEATGLAARTADLAEEQLETPALDLDSEVPVLSSSSIPWLPFRYARPNWAWTRTYRYPGGSVSRSLAPGTYLAIRQEAGYDGNLWYQTGQYDWIPATSVTLLEPSALRGIKFASRQTGPENPNRSPDRSPRLNSGMES